MKNIGPEESWLNGFILPVPLLSSVYCNIVGYVRPEFLYSILLRNLEVSLKFFIIYENLK